MKRESSRRALATAWMLCAIGLVSVCAGDALCADAVPQPVSSSSPAASSTPTPSIASALSSAKVQPISANPGASNMIAGTGMLGPSDRTRQSSRRSRRRLVDRQCRLPDRRRSEAADVEFQQPAVSELERGPGTAGRHSGRLDGRGADAVQRRGRQRQGRSHHRIRRSVGAEAVRSHPTVRTVVAAEPVCREARDSSRQNHPDQRLQQRNSRGPDRGHQPQSSGGLRTHLYPGLQKPDADWRVARILQHCVWNHRELRANEKFLPHLRSLRRRLWAAAYKPGCARARSSTDTISRSARPATPGLSASTT